MPEGGAIALGYVELAMATGLVVIAGLVSLGLRLGLEKKLAIGAVRTIVQLLAVGYVLRWVFGIDGPALLFVALFLMIAAASRAAVGRSKRVFPGAYAGAFVTLVLTGLVTTFTVTTLIIGVEPWYRPQYVLPLLGMLLGNGLTGISLALDTLLETLDDRAERIEMELALGATKWEAVREPLADAVRRGMIPIINAMMVVGIVSLPGMMTGQILAGADPLGAVKYQVVVMFMIAAATAMGCMMIALLAYRRLFNARHQLLRDLIRKH